MSALPYPTTDVTAPTGPRDDAPNPDSIADAVLDAIAARTGPSWMPVAERIARARAVRETAAREEAERLAAEDAEVAASVERMRERCRDEDAAALKAVLR